MPLDSVGFYFTFETILTNIRAICKSCKSWEEESNYITFPASMNLSKSHYWREAKISHAMPRRLALSDNERDSGLNLL